LGTYPRDEAGDVAKLASVGTSVVFAPTDEAVYPAGFATSIHIEGPAKAGLEDAFRPHFFDGVATVVTKLFTQTAADYAMFGEKDYQQLKVVSRMTRDLDLPIEIVGVPIMREADGLAMSSRNVYLSAAERHVATSIFRALNEAAVMIRGGATPTLAEQHAAGLLTAQGFKVDYVAARHAETLAKPMGGNEPLRLLAAAWQGKTRLIDNIAV
jgi:pantoate--beta-alanine ligase